MNIVKLDEYDAIKLAINSTDFRVLEKLANSIYVTVRRCVARNKNIVTKTANKLAIDPSVNVTYWALRNKQCTNKRTMIESDNECIKCTESELNYNNICLNCSHKVK